MFYDLLVNENYIINNDICNNDLNEFIKNQKYYILETVYNFLNNEKKEKYNEKSYFIFLNFILELKILKDKEKMFFDSFNMVEDISFNYDISNDIVLYKKLLLKSKKENKMQTIERIFKLDTD